MKMTEWAIARAAENEPVDGPAAGRRLQELVNALQAVRSGVGQVFGLDVSRLEDGGASRLETAVTTGLSRWKAHFEAANDGVSLRELDKMARKFGLRGFDAGRPPLRCDPLGSRDGLSPEWAARLARVEEALAGKRALDLEAIAYVRADDEENVEVEWGTPDLDKLYDVALRLESASGAMFPRELAAFLTLVDGITLDGDPFLHPVDDWDPDDEGLTIGCGGYAQGRLVISEPEDQARILEYPVVDIDDDGEERARYTNFAALLDALFGA